jgi:hypothetical protein
LGAKFMNSIRLPWEEDEAEEEHEEEEGKGL